VNHKKVYRVYREAGFVIRRKRKKTLGASGICAKCGDGSEQECGLLDFVHDAAESRTESSAC